MHVSRPLIALLVGTVAFFALWIVALKPSSSGPGGAQQGLGAYQSDINKAKAAVGAENSANARAAGGAPGQTAGTGPSGSATSSASTAPAAGSRPSSTPKPSSQHQQAGARHTVVPGTYVEPGNSAGAGGAVTPAQHFAAVQAGLKKHKVVALLFYNPSSSDDQAVNHYLATVPTHRGAVVKLAVPLQDLSRYSSLLNQVPVNFSPTLVLINAARQAEEITGFADPFEIDQRIAGALASSRPAH